MIERKSEVGATKARFAFCLGNNRGSRFAKHEHAEMAVNQGFLIGSAVA
jgi:hypothetical protein